MVTSSKTLKTEIDSRLAGGGLSALDCCQLQGAQTILANSVVVSVANCAALPCADLNQGRMIYLLDQCQYRISITGAWTCDFTSTSQVTSAVALWSWGDGSWGQIGNNSTTNRSSPVREISNSFTWCQISTGVPGAHTAAIKTDGGIWTWGRNNYGELGNNTTTAGSSPVREISSSTNWCQTSTGSSFVAAIKTDGGLWMWGRNSDGQLGDNSLVHRSSPVREITSSTTWCQTAAGFINTASIKTDGSLWLWGNASCGVMGNNSITNSSSPVREISSSTTWRQTSSGRCHASAIKTDGGLWAWGSNSCGRLGNNSAIDRSSPVREISSSTTWCQTATTCCHISAIKTDGGLWAWGVNTCGQLGTNTITPRSSPVREISSSTNWCKSAAGVTHNVAIKTDGGLWAVGSNLCGQLGDNTNSPRSSPVQETSSLTTWCATAAGSANTWSLTFVKRGFV